MKKIFVLLIALGSCFSSFSVIHTIVISGSSFSPNDLTVIQGDTVSIQASNIHPVVQVSEMTWNASGNQELSGGWGTKNSTFTHVVSSSDDIFYVCKNHVGSGMKGKITVLSNPTGIEEKVVTQTIYPNPVIDNSFSVSVKQNAVIDIYSIKGDLIEQQVLKQGSNRVQLKATSGNYLYFIKSEGITIEKGKLVVN